MAKKLKEIKIDGISFHVPHWAGKTLAEFTKEATAKDAAMIPTDVPETEKAEWLKTAHELITKANNGDESVKPDVNTEEMKAEAEAAKAKKVKDKPTS